MNDEILQRMQDGSVSDAEKQDVEVKICDVYNKKNKKYEKIRCVITEKQVQRFRDPGYNSQLKDIAVLLLYLEIPYTEWKNYYTEKSNGHVSIFEVIAPDTPLNPKQLGLVGSWDAYMYDPLKKQVFSHPILLTVADQSTFHIMCRGMNDKIYSGIAFFYGDYLVATLVNEKKTSAITMQVYINDHVLHKDPVLNTACTWVQSAGKPVQSVVIIYRAKNVYSSLNLPASQEKTIRSTDEPHEIKINHFIEYVSRKGEPELSPRWFKPNQFKEVGDRNNTEAARPRSFHLRADYTELERFFSTSNSGEWISFSKPYGPRGLPSDWISIYRWSFTNDVNRRIIEVECTDYMTDRRFEGALQYKQGHVSIYFNSVDGFRHFMARLDLFDIGHQSSAQKRIRGHSSIIENNHSLQLRELLVYTEQCPAVFGKTKKGKISVEDFMGLDIISEDDKGFVIGVGEYS